MNAINHFLYMKFSAYVCNSGSSYEPNTGSKFEGPLGRKAIAASHGHVQPWSATVDHGLVDHCRPWSTLPSHGRR